MRAKSVRIAVIIAAAFAAFVIYLCLSLTDITPFFLGTVFAAAACVVRPAPKGRFASVKLATQKNE
jgi:hypothetical protein